MPDLNRFKTHIETSACISVEKKTDVIPKVQNN